MFLVPASWERSLEDAKFIADSHQALAKGVQGPGRMSSEKFLGIHL